MAGYNVPAWAYLDPRASGGNWDYLASERITSSNIPEVTGGSSPTTLILPTSVTSPTSQNSNMASIKYTIIVGALLGALVLVLAGVLLWTLKKNRRVKGTEPAEPKRLSKGGASTYTGIHSGMSSPLHPAAVFPQPAHPAVPEV